MHAARLKNMTGLTVATLLTAFSWVQADTVVLNNGDQLTGKITQIDPTTVQLTSPVLGALRIPRDGIKILRSDAKVNIVDAAGQSHTSFVGPNPEATTWGERAEIVPPPSPPPPPAPIPTAPPAAVAAHPMNLEPYYLPVGPHWKNQLALGLINTSGNTESTQMSGEVDFNYQTEPHELNLKFGGAYGETNGSRDNQLAFGSAIYRRALPEWHMERWFLFAESHNTYNGIKGISFRTIDDGGLGYYLVKSERFNMDVRGGPGITYVKHFDGEDSTDLTGMVGLRAIYKLSNRVTLSEEALYSNGLTDTARYQIFSDTSALIKLPEVQRGFGFKLSFQDSYDSTVVSPSKQNDTRLILALTLDF